MSIKPFLWALSIKPDISLNADLNPSWSPDVYQAVVWDHNVNFNASVKAQARAEFAEFTYFQVNIELTLAHLTLGIQNFFMEDIPVHSCFMGYADVRVLDISIGFESNTKNCKKNFLQDFWWANLYMTNDEPEEHVEVPPLPIIKPRPIDPIPTDETAKTTDPTPPKPVEPVVDPKVVLDEDDKSEKEYPDATTEKPADDQAVAATDISDGEDTVAVEEVEVP